MHRRKDSVKGKLKTRFTVGAALLAVSMLFVSCPREVGLGGAVDTQKPLVSILTPEVDAVVKDVITLSGKASDETSLASVTVLFSSTESSYTKEFPAVMDIKAGTWSLTVDTEDATNGLPDYKYEVTVTAKDGSGKTSIAARSFQIDNSAPTILVTKPSTYGGNNEKETVTYYKQVEIRGEAYDASAIKAVKVGLYKGDGTLLIEKTADGTDTWSVQFGLSELASIPYPVGSAVSEPIYIYVKAEDKAENISTYYYHKSDMYSLLKTKKTSQTDELYFPTTTQIGYLDANRAALTVSGVKQDNTPISVPVTKEELNGTKHPAFDTSIKATYPHFRFTQSATATIEWNNIDTTSASIAIGSEILASIQPASDGSSVNLDSLSVKLVRPDDATYTPQELEFTTLRMGEAVNLSIKVPLSQMTGLYDLVLYGTTNGGSVIGFYYDNANPPADADLIDNDGYIHDLSIESTSITINTFKPQIINANTIYPDPTPQSATANIWYVNNDYYIIADVTGMSVNTGVSLIINNDETNAITVPKTNLTGDWAGTSYENNGQILHMKYKVTNASMPDVATIVLKAGGVTKQLNIEKDATAPEVNITSPVSGKAYADITGDFISLKGTATDDGAGIKDVYYTLGSGTSVADPTTASSKATKSGSNWSISWDTSNQEGTYTLKIMAEDNLSQLGTVKTVSFYKDASDPGLTETYIGSSGSTKKDAFKLEGKAWDTNQIDEITVSATVNGTTKIWSSKEGGSTTADTTGKIKKITLKPDSEVNSKVSSESFVTANNWSIDFVVGSSNSTQPTYIADGTTSFTITIKDAAGKSKAYTRTVTVDTVKPSFPTGSTGFADTVVGKDVNSYSTLTVKVEDALKDNYASGIEGVYYQITDDSVTTAPAFTSETGWTSMAVGTNGYTANVNFSSVSDDKAQKAWIAAKDIAGNRIVSTTTYSTFVDQHKPVLTVDTAASDANYNLQLGRDVKIKVRMTDSNAGTLAASDITVKKPNGDAITSITGDITVTKTDEQSGYKEFEITVPFYNKPDYFKNGGNYVDGTYTVVINGKDVKNRAAEAVTHSILMDTSAPEVTITNYQTETYTSVGSIIVEGKVFDAQLQKVEAWLEADSRQDITALCTPDDAWAAANPSATAEEKAKHLKFSWTKFVGEGTYVAHVQATDMAQATNDPNAGTPDAGGKKTASITVDLTDPVSTLKQKTASTIYTEAGTAISDAATELTGTDIYLAKGAFTLQGVITEANLASATLTVKKDNVAISGSPFNLMQNGTNNTWTAGTQTWEYTQGTTAGDGTYTYTLILEDKAQRKSTKNLTVKIDTTAPTVNITGPAAGESFLTAPITIKGTAIDSGAGASKVYYTYGAPNSVADPTTSSSSINVNGSSWNADILSGASVAEGTYELKVIAADKLGNLSSSAVQSVQFSYDLYDPDLTNKAYVTSTLSAATPSEIADGASTTGNFTLKGKAWDTNKIDEITVTDGTTTWSSKNAGEVVLKPDSEVNSKVGSAAAVTADNWSINFTTGSDTSGATYIADGTTTFTITIKDIAGKSRSYNRSITVDTVKPSFPTGSAGFANAVVGKDVNAYNTLTVKVADDPRVTGGYASGIEGVFYKITEENVSTAPSFDSDTGWTAMSQSSSGYTATVDFSAVDTDKSQKAWIAAKDRAGNRIVSATTYSTFIDQHKPVMTVSGETFTSKDQGTNAHDLVLTVRVTDTNPTAPTVAVYKPKSDGKAVGNVSDLSSYTRVDVDNTADANETTKIYVGVNTATGSYTDYKVVIPFKSNPTVFTPDGQYTVIINGKDAQNRVADQIAHEVLQDSEAPVVEITKYADVTTGSPSIKVNTIAIEGKATDANMTSVTAWLTKDGTDLDSVDITNTRKTGGIFTWTQYDLAEGVYVAHIVAKDQANQETAKETANITVDLTAPKTDISRISSSTLYTEAGDEVSVTTLLASNAAGTDAGTYLSKTGFTLEGTLEEKYLKSAKLTVKKNNTILLNGIDMTTTVGSRTSGGTNSWSPVAATPGTYKWTYTGGSDGDGSYFITIDLEDNAGNRTQKTLTIKVDTTAPTLLVTTPGEGQSSSISTITLRGTADDDGAGVKKVHYAYYDINADLSANPAPTPVGEGDAEITGNTWKKEVSFAAEGTYKLVVTATDNLGLTATTASPITFSFDCNDPELVETKIGNDSTTTNGGTAKTFTLGGKAWDTNAIDEITVSTTVAGVTKTWSSKEGSGTLVSTMINTTIDSKVANAAAVSADNWSITFKVGNDNKNDTMFIADGTNSFTIVIKDIAGKSRSYNRTVTVDTTVPTISIADGDGFPAIVNETTTYVVEQDKSPYATLKVTASDPVQSVTGATATGLAGVYYKITLDNTQPAFSDADEANWTAMTQGASGWSANVDFSSSAYADKDVRAWIAAKDRAGNRVVYTATENKLKAFVDKMQPVIVVQSAADFTSQSADLVMTVRVKDTNPSNPTVTIYKPKADGSVVPENELASATRVNVSPSANIEDVDNTSAADPYKEYKITIPFKTSKSEFGSDGTYTIALNEKDGKNRTANQIVWTVLQDTQKPVVTLKNYTANTPLNVNTIAATATISDANLTKIEAWLVKGGVLQDGQNGTENTLETLYDKTAGINKGKTVNGELQYNYTKYSLEDAVYEVYFLATDAANQTTEAYTADITVDTVAPLSTIEQNTANSLYDTAGNQVSVTTLTQGGTYLSKAGYTLKGVITENHLKSAKLTVKKDGVTKEEALDLTNIASSKGSWNSASKTWTYIQAIASTGGDGTYTYSLALEDEAGNTATETLTVKVDTTAPTLIITTPGADQATSSTQMTIRGTVDDAGAGIKKVVYSYEDTTLSEEATVNGNSWSDDITFVDEGSFTLYAKAIDNLGWESDTETVQFSYDKADPELKELVVGNDSTTVNAGFTLGGKAWDSNAIDEITISTTVGGETKTWSTKTGTKKITLLADNVVNSKVATEAAVTANNWSMTFVVGTGNASESNFIADGTNSFTITIKDIAGKSRSYNRTITVDSTAPTLTVDTGDGFASALVEKDISAFVEVKVHAADNAQSGITGTTATGLAGVYYQITNGDVTTAPSFTSETGWTAMSQGTGVWTANVNFSSITEDCSKKVWFAAKDRAGNRTVYTESPAALKTKIDQHKPVLAVSGDDFTAATGNMTLSLVITDSNAPASDQLDLIEVAVYKPADGGSALDLTTASQELKTAKKVALTSYPVSGPTGANQTVERNYSITIPFNSSLFGDDNGDYTITVNAKDANGRAADQVTHIVQKDTSAPSVTLSSYQSATSTNVGTLTVTGTVTDKNLEEVLIWLNNDTANAENITTKRNGSGVFTWTKYELPEDDYIVHVKATDKAGLYSEKQTETITVDMTAPKTSIEQNAASSVFEEDGTAVTATTLLASNATGIDAGTYLAKTAFTLKGVVVENQISSATLTVKKDNGTPTELNLYSVDPTTQQVVQAGTGCTWNSTTKTWTYAQTTHENDGTYVYSVKLVDKAGNQTTETVTVKVDTTKPSVSITKPSANESFSTTGAIQLNGTASDAIAGINKVYYTTNGDTPTTSSAAASVTGNSWSVESLSGITTEGRFQLQVMAEDKLGFVSDVSEVYFSYDKAYPELDETGLGSDGQTKNTGFRLKGRAWDSNEIDEITISAQGKTWSNKSGANQIQVASIITPDGITAGKKPTFADITADNWGMDFVVGSSNEGGSNYLADGTIVFTITIKDIAGKSNSYNRTVTVDSKAPTISLTETDGFAKNADNKNVVWQDISPYSMLNVTVADNPQVTGGYKSGLEGVWYKITSTATPPTDDDATWTNIDGATDGWTAMSQGTTKWSANVDFSDTSKYSSDHEQYAWIAAKDRAGNRTILVTTPAVTFVDMHKPVLSIDTATNANFTDATANLEIIVRETDTNPNTPTVTVLKPNGDELSSAGVSIEVSATETNYKEYKVTVPFYTSANYGDDGTYTLKIDANDLKNRAADQITWTVLKDQTAPVVELTSYTTATFTSNRTLTVTGKVKDDNLSSVIAWLDDNESGAENITALLGSPDAADGNKQSFEWKQYDVPEGTHYVHIKATDRANLVNTSGNPAVPGLTSAAITIDITAPDSDFAYEGDSTDDKLYTNMGSALLQPVLSGGGTYLAKTGFTLKGTITETNFQDATLSIKKDNVDQPSQPINAAGAWSYVQAATDGTYEYTLTVNDKANNQFKQTVTVKVDTTAPILTIETPGEGQSTNQNSLGITGSVTDTGAGNVTVLYSIDGSDPSISATVTGSSWNDTINFNNVEGAFVLKIKAKDVLGNETSVQTRNFSYDLNIPGIDENVVTSTGLTTNTGFTLGGKAWDTNAIDEITITGQGKTWSSKNAGEITLKPDSQVNSKVNAADDVTANNWSINFVVGSSNSSEPTYVADGTVGFTITIKDVAGKKIDISRTVSVDTVNPVITEEATDGFANGLVEKDISPYNRLTIHASDTGTGATGLEGVWYQIAATKPAFATTADEAAWTAMAQGTGGAWTANVDFSSVTANGDQFAWIAAKDRAGNRIVYEGATALDDGSIKTYVDIMKPVLSVEKMNPTTEIPDFTDAITDMNFRVRVTDTNPVLPTISVKDKDGIAVSPSGLSIEEDLTVDGSAGYKDWKVTVPFRSQNSTYNKDGDYTFTINGTDAKGRAATPITHGILRDTTDPEVMVSLVQSATTQGYTNQGTITATGTVADANLTTVTATLVKDGVDQTPVDITATLGNDGSFTWKQYDQTDATYKVKITATDKAGHQKTVTSYQVIVDKTAPDSAFAWDTTGGVKLYNTNGSEAESLSAGGSYMAKTAFQLRGVITEANLKKGTISVSKDGATPVDYPFFQSGSFTAVDLYNSSTHEWFYAQSATSADGTYVYTVKLEDKAGNRFEKSVTVLVDTAAPELVITKPAQAEQLENATFKFAGTVSDQGAGVNTVTYVLKNGGTTIDSGNATRTGGSWAINGSDGTGVSLGSEGTLEIEVTATDKLGQTTTEKTTFYYDQGAPTLDETNIGVSTLITREAFTLTGTVSDTNALAGYDATAQKAVGAISISTGSGAGKVDYGTVDVTGLTTASATGNWEKIFTPGTGNGQLADGTYTFAIKATDVSGRETTIQRTIVVDTVDPTISTVAGKITYITDTATNTWFNKGTLNIGASVSDDRAGGVASVEYAVISNPASDPTETTWQTDNTLDWKSMTKGASYYTASAEVKDGKNYIVIRAKDAAGNIAYTAQEIAKVDTLEPTLEGAYNEEACTTEVLTKVTNTQKKIKVYIKTKDAHASVANTEVSGVTDVVATIGDKEFAAANCISTSGSDNVYLLELESAKLQAAAGATDASKTVFVKITDIAGNVTSATSLFTLQFDTTGPDIEFVSPASETTTPITTVNKTISITGKANDLQGLKNVTLYYLYNSTNEDDREQIGGVKTGKDATNWSFTFDTTQLLNTVLTQGQQSDLTLIAKAEDEAGNVGSESITIKIDQSEDIPTVTITQPETLAGMTSSAPRWLKGNNKVTGTLTDDDGIAQLQMSTDNGTNWTNIPVSGGYFQATLPIDDTYTVLFKVTDTAGGVFTSGNTGLTALNLKDGAATPTTSADGRLYITVDTENPQIQPTKFAIDGTSTTDADWTTTLLNDRTFGGTADTEFTLKQYVFDENGIDKVEVIIDGGTPVEAAKQTGDTYTDVTTGDEYTAYTYRVDATTLGTNLNHTLKIRVTDKAEMTNEISTTFKTDNDAPTVTLGSHAEEERVKGTLFVSGTTQDAPLYGPAATMLYKVTASAATPTDWTTTQTSSTDYGAHTVAGNLANWRIYFDDDLDSVDGYTHDRALKKVLTQINSDLEIATSGEHINAVVWKNAGSGHNAGDLYTPLTMMYLHLKATDAYGNETYFTRALELDPQGDIPSIEIAYPSVAGYGWRNGSSQIFTASKLPEVGDNVYTDIANMSTAAGTISAINRAAKTITYNGTIYNSYGGETVQGGIVRVQGTADGQNAIKAIFMQIDPAYNRATGFTWDPTGNATMPNGEALKVKYPNIESFYAGSSMKGIKVGDSVSWSASLNKNGEFNGVAPTQGAQAPKTYIGIRLYAVDEKNNVSPLNVANDIIVTIDSDSPQVGSSEELYLYQYSDNVNGTGTVTASMKYEDDMWLKGEWWIKGSVEDASGIASVSVQTPTNTDYPFQKSADPQTEWSASGTKGYTVQFKIGSSAAGFGKLVYQINATDKDQNAKSVTKQISINYDNTAPVLASPSHENYNINHEVVQSNGFYTLGSSITETGNSTDSQSGFARVALYFVRPGSSKSAGTIYDTYFLKSNTSNQIAQSGLTYSEGLYWKTKMVTRSAENLSSLTLNAADANIHKGGLVKIGGTDYIITSVSGKNITINGSPAYATAQESVQFAMGALVIDHAITEGNGTTANLVDGYYTDVVNDDGDNIVEKVTTQGYTTYWEANICSRNIPDGAIEIHYVAFDKAGNYSVGVVACAAAASYKGEETPANITYDYDANNTARVANNAPRLAGVLYGTDDDGNGTVEDDEMHADLFAMTGTFDANNALTKESYTNSSLRNSYLLGIKNGTTYSAPVLKIKGATKIVPEIVGGNGTLEYSLKATKNGASAPYFTREHIALSDTGSDYSATGAASEIKDVAINLSVVDLLKKSNGVALDDDHGEPQLFEFTIWDSTAGMTRGTDSQKATLEMVAVMNMKDATPPTTYIKPFYWKSTTDNSVYKKSENGKSYLMGHIELGSEIGTLTTSSSKINDADDKVSGAIIIEGTAQDNVLLKDIYMKFFDGTLASGTNRFAFTGADAITDGDADKYYRVATYNNGTWTSKSPLTSFGTNGWAFVIDEESETFSQEEGHTVQWKLYLNTEKLTRKALGDLQIAVIAQDKGNPKLEADNVTVSYSGNTNALADTPVKTSGDTTATQTNYNQFDVVPYITGVSTNLSSLKKNNPSVYNRTALGKYPVASNETVVLAGFNLEGAQYNGATLTSLTTAEIEKLLSSYTTGATSFVKLPVSNVSTSGGIQITNNSIPTLNNVNNNDAKGAAVDENEQPVTLTTANYDSYAYNRQPNGDNNLNLTDDVYLDVWSINNNAATSRDGGSIDEPVMKINPANGTIGFAFASGADSFCMPGGSTDGTQLGVATNSYYYWSRNYANFSNIALDYDSSGYSFAIAVGLDTNTDDNNGGYSGRMALMTSLWGRNNTPSWRQNEWNNEYANDWDNFNGTSKLRIDSIGIPTKAYAQGVQKDKYQIDPKRFSSTSLKVMKHGNDRAVYLAYYDRLAGQIRFRSGSTSATTKDGLQSSNDSRYFGQFYDAYGYNNNNTQDNCNAGYTGNATGSGDYTQHRSIEITENQYSLIAGNESRPANARNGISGIGADTGFTAGNFVALDVVDNGSIAGDTVVVVFYDGSDLWYVSRTGGVGTDENVKKGSTSGKWTEPVMIFEGIGQNATIKVDPDKGIHIACYDHVEGCLKYAYMSSASATNAIKTAKIDGYGITGSNISIDVVKENGVSIPYISYYAPSIQKVKVAYLADASKLTSTVAGALDGCDDADSYTGVWECEIIPSTSAVNDDNTSIGFYKNGSGVAQQISTSGTASANKDSGLCKGNGTSNAAIAYGITRNATGYIEVVQKK